MIGATLCWCSKYTIRPQDATYVCDGQPCCSAMCYAAANTAARARKAIAVQMENRERRNLVRVPFFDHANELED